jgi:3',5'-cyclic AMP phosphodiesterase CpdA
MRIAHLSDLHFTHLNFHPRHLFSKRLFGMVNWLLFRKAGSDHERLSLLPELFNSLKVDQILIAGDLTSTSFVSEFKAARAFSDQFKQPVLFIPGNHDHYTAGAYQENRFYQFFSNRKPVFGSLPQKRVEAHPLGQWGWCVLLDTAAPSSWAESNGHFSPEIEAALEELLRELPSDAPILLVNHFPFFQNDLPEHRLVRGEALESLLERHPNIRLYLHGHTHRHCIADLTQNGLPLILDSGCPIQKNHATWNLIDLEKDGCTVEAYHWTQNKWDVFRECKVALV